MKFQKSLKVSLLEDGLDLDLFCKSCKNLGYNNNSSLDAMRFAKTKQEGEFWGAWYYNKLIAVAGAHPLPEVSPTAIRVLFRGCQLYSPHEGLNASHMNSVPFGDILPYQIEMYKDYDLYTTTNIINDSSGKMHRTHKVMSLLAKKGIVDLVIDNMIIYNTQQSVWKLNKDVYLELRNSIRKDS